MRFFRVCLPVSNYPTVVNSTIAQWKWMQDIGDNPINYFEKDSLLGFYISQICWVVVLWIVKCSVLAFYWRLFSRNGRSTRLLVWTIAVAVMCWGLAAVRSLSSIPWLFFSIKTMIADPNRNLVVDNDLSMFSYRCVLEMGLRPRTYPIGM